MQAAASAVGQQIVVVEASSEYELDPAFAALVQRGAGALILAADIFFNRHREWIVALAARHRLRAIYDLREFAAGGGLMGYGTNVLDAYYQNGVYIGRILKGAEACNLPVMQSAKFEFVINLKTAATLGRMVPPNLLTLAGHVIE